MKVRQISTTNRVDFGMGWRDPHYEDKNHSMSFHPEFLMKIYLQNRAGIEESLKLIKRIERNSPNHDVYYCDNGARGLVAKPKHEFIERVCGLKPDVFGGEFNPYAIQIRLPKPGNVNKSLTKLANEIEKDNAKVKDAIGGFIDYEARGHLDEQIKYDLSKASLPLPGEKAYELNRFREGLTQKDVETVIKHYGIYK